MEEHPFVVKGVRYLVRPKEMSGCMNTVSRAWPDVIHDRTGSEGCDQGG